jgi:hypothetical protein
VRARADVCPLISATIVVESSPPLRKAPTGTSATVCRFTARSSSTRIWSTASASSMFACENRGSQYRHVSHRPSAATVIACPGDSVCTFA